MKIDYNKLIEKLLSQAGVYKATKYYDPKLVVKASRKRYNGKLPAKNQNLEVVLTIGRPNYEEREFIKLCKEAKELFPVQHIQLKYV